MKKRGVHLSMMAVAMVLAVVGIWMLQLHRFPLEKTALERDVAEQFINSGAMDKAELQVEEINEIGNVATILFSVHDGEAPSAASRLGLAFYGRNRLGGTYRFESMGWGSNTFDSYLFEASAGSKKGTYFVVYGKTPSVSKEFERFKVTFRGEVFDGNMAKEEYFVDIFPVANELIGDGVGEITFVTKDLYTESFPLPVTSTIK